METVFKGMTVFRQGTASQKDLLVIDGLFAEFSRSERRTRIEKYLNITAVLHFPVL